MARGARFASNKASSSDADGHSLPSDKSMHYIELQLVCGCCPLGDRPILAAFWIESHFEEFDPNQVNERENRAMIRQMVDGRDGRQRFVFQCPKCSNSPVLKQETVDGWLAAAYGYYGKGARAAVVGRPI